MVKLDRGNSFMVNVTPVGDVAFSLEGRPLIKIFVLWIWATHVPCDNGMCTPAIHSDSKNYATLKECNEAKATMAAAFRRDQWRRVTLECTSATLPFLEPAPLAEK